MADKIDLQSSEKIVYVQEDVFVHTTQGTSTFYDNIVRGKLTIVVKQEFTYVIWKPISDLSVMIDYNDPVEYGVITTKETELGVKPQVSLNQIQFDVKDIHSMRRSDPRLAWSYVVFILKDKTTHPALHFHNGGINEMISCLQRFIWLMRSSVNHKLYIVQQREAIMQSNINQLELFSDNPSDLVSKFINNTYYGTLSGFSKVTQYVLGTIGHNDLFERRPQNNDEQNLENGEEYEFLQTDEPDLLGPIIPAAREMCLDLESWCAYMEDDGKISNVSKLKEKIFHGGIHQDIKREVWKFLLGFYPFDSTYVERNEITAEKTKLYNTMMMQWKTITPAQEKRFSEFSQKKNLVEKDAVRTDRKLKFFAGEENVKKLFNILMTYCMYNFDLGYVQGMSDLLSPILQLMEDEVDSFWCFVGLMEIEQANFEMTQVLMKTQLEKLASLIEYLYPNFFSYLKCHDSDNLYFCFRWILITFKRDFNNNDLMVLWEALWCQSITPHFKLFICLAILEREKDIMMKNNYNFNEILRHINDLAYKIDLEYILSRAESICLQMQKTEDLPENLRQLCSFTEKDTLSKNLIENNDQDFSSSVFGTEKIKDGAKNEEVVKLLNVTNVVF
ncbi:TBC1 domain family member 15 isoform X1 [Hydra vulgaris]|uniref:TBC1 domain family member 15 n=1 Tax=Hydra vulgaris TaxID=6087 RepID=T2M8X7_HYDVU|nr:TBC1 domain family member 15 [Hydra vulgaris]